MTEKQPLKAPKSWRGKPRLRPGFEHWGELKPITHEARPNLLMRIGSRFFDKLTGK